MWQCSKLVVPPHIPWSILWEKEGEGKFGSKTARPIMPHLVRENLFIGNFADAVEILQNGSTTFTHILSVLTSASISYFTECKKGLTIPTKEISKVYAGGASASAEDDGSSGGKLVYLLEYAGKDLKLVRMGVPIKDMESENLLDYLEVCLDFIDKSRKEGSVLVHCFAGVSRRYTIALFILSLILVFKSSDW